MAKNRNITTTQLALMTAAAVISLRGLPMMAQEELTMFFYIFFATFLFLIPAALVGAELGSAFASKGGGVYTWVKEAFNKHMGFTAIFLQWIQNVVWYPTVLGFAAASIAYMIGMPGLAQNGLFVGLFSIAMYWCATLVTLRGTSAISGITSKGFLIGTVLPGIVVIVMAVVWMIGGNSVALEHIPDTVSQVVNIDAAHHVHPRLFPHITGMSDIAFLAGILLLFAGVEVHAVHAPELKKPQTQFPRAMFLAALISFGLFTLGALAVAIITPYDQINLQSGLFTTFQIVFEHYHVGWLTNVMGLLVAFGALAGVMSWISGPSRGLLWTAQEGVLPCFLQKTNKNGVQKNILLIQGCVVTLLALLFVVMPSVQSFYQILSQLTVLLYLIMYMLMFSAAIVLRYKMKNTDRPFRLGKGNGLMWFLGCMGFCGALLAFVLSFVPPSQISTGSNTVWFSVLIIGCVVVVGAPFVIYALRKPSWKDPQAAAEFAPFHWETQPVAAAPVHTNTPEPTAKPSETELHNK